MLMSSVQTEIISFAVAFCTNIFAAVKAAIQISNTETIVFLFIFMHKENISGHGNYCENDCQYYGHYCAYQRNPLKVLHSSFLS